MKGQKKASGFLCTINYISVFLSIYTQFAQHPKLGASRSPKVVSFALKRKTVRLV